MYILEVKSKISARLLLVDIFQAPLKVILLLKPILGVSIVIVKRWLSADLNLFILSPPIDRNRVKMSSRNDDIYLVSSFVSAAAK